MFWGALIGPRKLVRLIVLEFPNVSLAPPPPSSQGDKIVMKYNCLYDILEEFELKSLLCRAAVIIGLVPEVTLT